MGASAEVLRQQLASDGYTATVHFAGDDIPLQLTQLGEVLDAAPVAVVIAPVEATSIAAVLDDKAASEVAVIAYNELILDSEEVDYFATFDHYEAGRIRAEALIDALDVDEHPDAGPFAIELLAGSGDDRAAQEAFAGSLEVLQPYLDAGVVTVPSGRLTAEAAAVLRADPATAASRIRALLDEGVQLAGVLSPRVSMSSAIAEALTEAGLEVAPAPGGWPDPPTSQLTEPTPEATPEPSQNAESPSDPVSTRVVVTGGGSTRAGVRAVRDGALSATVYENPRELARVVASMVSEVVAGSQPTVTRGVTRNNGVHEVPTRLLTPLSVATRADAVELLG